MLSAYYITILISSQSCNLYLLLYFSHLLLSLLCTPTVLVTVNPICLFNSVPGGFVIRHQFYCSISDDNCSRKADANEMRMGCHTALVIFQGDKTRSSKLLNANQIPQYTMKVLHTPAVFNLQPEDHHRCYPGRYRPLFRPTCKLFFS